MPFLPEPTTGIASARGPHIAAQCRLPTKPMMNAARSIFLAWRENDRLLEVVIVVQGPPTDVNLPKADLQFGDVDLLQTAWVDRKREFLIQTRIGRTIQVNCAFERRTVRRRQFDSNILTYVVLC